MAAQSNINVAREFIQANKQALADMGVAAKELDKIFKSLEDGLDKQGKLNKDQLETYKKSIEFARQRAAAEAEVTKQKKKQKTEETALDKQISSPLTPSKDKFISNAFPTGIKLPVSENPTTVVELLETIKPFSSALPPLALLKFKPLTIN